VIAILGQSPLDVAIVVLQGVFPCLAVFVLAGAHRARGILDTDVHAIESDMTFRIVADFLLRLGWLRSRVVGRRRRAVRLNIERGYCIRPGCSHSHTLLAA